MYSASGIGYLAQYFCVGLIYGGLPATVYGFFLGYLNVPAHVYATVHVIMTLPWSFKFAFGLLNDCAPIGGYRRKPYMVIGWAIAAPSCSTSPRIPLPAVLVPRPRHRRVHHQGDEGRRQPRRPEPCNAHAAKERRRVPRGMMCAALGYVVADVAADGAHGAVRAPRSRKERQRLDADARVRRAQFGRRAIEAILRNSGAGQFSTASRTTAAGT